MSNSDERERHAETMEDNDAGSLSESEPTNKVHGHRTMQNTQPQPQLTSTNQVADNQVAQQPHGLPPRAEGYRNSAVRESRIKDRPTTQDAKDSAVKIKIELDLEVEVDLYARVKGDVTIGLL